MAYLTWTLGPRGLAKEHPTQPESQLLFPGPFGSVDEKGSREGFLEAGLGQSLQEGPMAPMGVKAHGVRVRDLSHCRGSIAWGAPPATGARI